MGARVQFSWCWLVCGKLKGLEIWKTRKDFFTKVFFAKVWNRFCFFELPICPFKDFCSKVSNEKTPPAQGPVHHPESMALRIFSDASHLFEILGDT